MLKTKDSVITTMLLSLGIRSNLKGYIYLKAAILVVLENPALKYKTMKLYEKIAIKYSVSAENVERCIRYVITDAYYHNRKYLREKFPQFRSIPTNSEMIAILSEMSEYEYQNDEKK